MEVQFIQFLLPFGEARPTSIDVPEEVGTRANELREAGFHFEAEVLRTGEVSLECCRTDEDGEADSLGHEIEPNGPGLPEAVIRLIDGSHGRWKARA